MKKSSQAAYLLVLVLGTLRPLVAHSQGAPVQAQQPQALVMAAENLNATDDRHRAIAAKQGNPQALLSGDVVRYRLTFTNLRADSVKNVQFKDAMPDGLHYVAGSAKADRTDVLVEFSIDKGLSYSAQPMVDVTENGMKVRRPAPVTMYTHVRWSVQGWVKPHAQVVAEFRAQLGATAPSPNVANR